MPTRRQKRRKQQSMRHEHVWYDVDEYGNETAIDPSEEKSSNGAKPAEKKKKEGTAPARGARRSPQPPSWQRAARRALILGAVVFALFGMLNKNHNYGAAAGLALIYTALFIPFTYFLDRFTYRRWQAREQNQSKR